MNEDIIGMTDMAAIYDVTDRFGIDREAISVPLEKAERGSVKKDPSGELEITVPAVAAADKWIDFLRSELELLGFELRDIDEDSE